MREVQQTHTLLSLYYIVKRVTSKWKICRDDTNSLSVTVTLKYLANKIPHEAHETKVIF